MNKGKSAGRTNVVHEIEDMVDAEIEELKSYFAELKEYVE